MIFDDPMPWQEALDRLKAKRAIPTDLSSAEIRDSWDAELRQRALFSARTTKADVLEAYRYELGQLLSGKENRATARAEIRKLIDGLGYTPESGFPDEGDETIPPAERDSLQDLASEARVDLVLETNSRQVANFAFREQGQSEFSLYAYPCYELVRIYARRVPRGEKLQKGVIVPDPGEDWPSRWEKAGGQFYDGRMIARKDDDIWNRLGSTELFDDGLDSPVPPFAFNSGYGWREIRRDEAVRLGVIDDATDVAKTKVLMNAGLQANASRFSTDFLKAVKADLKTIIAAKRLKLAANAFNPNQPRIPKGQRGGGQFASGGPTGPTDPMALGKTVKRARKMLEDDLAKAGLDKKPAHEVVANLRKLLKVKKPVPVMSKLAGVSGGTPRQRALAAQYAQETFDMLPPRVVNGQGAYAGLPHFEIKIVDLPHANYRGQYLGGPPPVIELNSAFGGVRRETVFHEMGHLLSQEGPPSYKAAIQQHFERRTFGEATQNNGVHDFKRDQLFDDYEGKIYPFEPPSGSGVEIPARRMEHMGSGAAALHAQSGQPNADKYRETQAVALSIFYYGRGK